MRITIFGTGYVGLVTGACFAEVGNDVVCVDVDDGKIQRLNRGEIPIYEPGLETMVKRNREAGRLRFTDDAALGVRHGEFQFIAVGTPPDEDGSADLRHVLTVAATIAGHMDGYRVIIDKSTVPVGTADRVRETVDRVLAERGVAFDYAVVSNPEFLKEGAAVEDFMKPERVIVGSDDEHALEQLHALYAPFNRNRDRLISMDVRSAELTKYAANAMLATKISFMNELANIADRVGADIERVRIGIGSDPRIGYHFIYPGAGYGGSCFPKDVQALARTAHDVDYVPQLLQAVEEVNDRQKHYVFQRIREHFQGRISGRRFAIWGLAFKPNTDDMREAASRRLMESLWEAGAVVQAFDPKAMEETRVIYGDRDDLVLCDSPEAALENADALVIMTEWNLFRSPDFRGIAERLSEPVIFDGRNLFDPDYLAGQGFYYYAIGRPSLPPFEQDGRS